MYGGRNDISCVGGSKPQAYLEKIGTKWYFCTPLGHASFFQGVSHLDYGQSANTDGGYKYTDIISAKYASDPNAWQYGWVDNTLARLKSWGFNAIGDSASEYVMPFFGAGPARLPATKLPVMPSVTRSRQAFFNTNGYASQGTKSLMDTISGSSYTGYVGRGLADVFDPVFTTYLNGINAATQADSHYGLTFSSPYAFAFSTDEGDDMFGLAGSGPLESPAPPDGIYHPHVGYIVIASKPTLASSAILPWL